MNFLKNSLQFTVLLVITFLFSCKPNVESEIKRFEQNVSAMEELSSQFPVYSSFIEDRIVEIEERWEGALKITDLEKQAKELSTINKDFTTKGICGNIYQVNKKHSSVNSKLKRVNDAKWPSKNTYMIKDYIRSTEWKSDLAIKELDRELLNNNSEFFAKSRSEYALKKMNNAMDDITNAEKLLREKTDKNAKKSTKKKSTAKKSTKKK